MSAWPLVSVVIVNWNAKAYLAECVASLKREVYAGPMQIVVVDNGSTDGSIDMVRDEHPEVTLLCNGENLGFAKANNIGIGRCSGDYVALVNSDVCVLKDCMTTLVRYCEEHRSAGLVGPLIMGPDGMQQRSCRGAPGLWNMFCRALALDVMFGRTRWANGYLLQHLDHRARMNVDILSGCFWLTNRTALRDVGLLDESFFIYGEDMDWCKRFRDRGWGVVFVPEARAIHHGGASSNRSPIRFFLEKQRADLQYWGKHRSRAAATCYRGISVLHHTLRMVGHFARSCLTIGRDGTARYKAGRSLACVRWLLAGDHANEERR